MATLSYVKAENMFNEKAVYLNNISNYDLIITVSCEKKDSFDGSSFTQKEYNIKVGRNELIGFTEDFGSVKYKYAIINARITGGNGNTTNQKSDAELQLEMDRLNTEKQRVEIERQRLAAEEEGQRIEKERLKAEAAKKSLELEKNRIIQENKETGGANFRLKNGVIADNIEMVKKAILEKANPAAVFENGLNLLFYVKGNPLIAQLLIEKGADISNKRADGYTPLHLVHNPEVAGIFIKYGVDLNTKGNNGYTALDQAIIDGRNEVAKFFIEKNIKIDYQRNTSFLLACGCDNPAINFEMVKVLLAKNCNPNVGEHLPLYCAAQKNNIEFATFLLENGADAKAYKKKYTYNSFHSMKMKKLFQAYD